MIFIDTNIFMYAAGSAHSNKGPCVTFLEKVVAAGQASEYSTNTEVLQEILHRYTAIGKQQLGFEIYDLILGLQLTIHPIELLDLHVAKKLMVKYPKLSTRDCVHLGMAVRRGFKIFVTCDRDFASVEELKIAFPDNF